MCWISHLDPPKEGNIDNVSIQLERLKSPNKNTRFDACELLRVAPTIPPEAIEALRLATGDPDRLVAEAAKDAIAAHMQSDATYPLERSPAAAPVGFWYSPWKRLLAVAVLFLATFLPASGLLLMRGGDPRGISDWLLVFPGFCFVLLPRAGDYMGPEYLVAGWSIYLSMILAIAIMEGRLARALYVALAFVLLVNLVVLMLFFG